MPICHLASVTRTQFPHPSPLASRPRPGRYRRPLPGRLFDYHLLQFYVAFKTGDRPSFEREARRLGLIMDDLAGVVATRPEYWMAPTIAKALRTPGAGPETAERVRDGVSIQGSYLGSWGLMDYNAKNFYELVQGYCRPRVDFYIEVLRRRLAQGDRTVDWQKELEPGYREIALRWVRQGYSPLRQVPRDCRPAGEVLGILQRWGDLSRLDLTPFFGPEVHPGKQVGWEEDFDGVTDWEGFHYEVSFDLDPKEYPILSFRVREHCGERIHQISIGWRDSGGEVHWRPVYPTTEMWASGEWEEFRADLEGLLTLLGRLEATTPDRLVGIRIIPHGPPHNVEWDWVRITSRA